MDNRYNGRQQYAHQQTTGQQPPYQQVSHQQPPYQQVPNQYPPSHIPQYQNSPAPYSPYQNSSYPNSPYQQSPSKFDYVSTETELLVSGESSSHPPTYNNVIQPLTPGEPEGLSKKDKTENERLKQRIRQLKLVSRAAATCLSIASFIPIAMTVYKFQQTKNIFRDVTEPDGTVVHRNLWAINTRVWPTLMYAAVGAVSIVLNLAVMLSYIKDVGRANRTAKVASLFSTAILVGNIILWTVAAAIYRKEKNPNAQGKSTDLWGWTCSTTAVAIQHAFQDQISYNHYCTVQSTSWFFGLAQVAVGIISAVTYYLALKRLKVQKRLQQKKQTEHQQTVYTKI